MKTVHAIFEGGVFKPEEPVDLPESTRVEFELRLAPEAWPEGEAMAEIYEVLAERHHSGEHDVAARVDEHQP